MKTMPQTPETAQDGHYDGYPVKWYKDPTSGYFYVQFQGRQSWLHVNPDQEYLLERL